MKTGIRKFREFKELGNSGNSGNSGIRELGSRNSGFINLIRFALGTKECSSVLVL